MFFCCTCADEQTKLCFGDNADVVDSGQKGDKEKTVGHISAFSARAPIDATQEDDRETAKQRLQRLIRDFAHDAVGPGLPVEVSIQESEEGTANFQGMLRLDRRLSQVEIWPAVEEGTSSSITVPFNQVKSVSKFSDCPDIDISETKDGDAPSLTIESTQKPTVKLCFDSAMSRDRAYTCLRIFHMSMDQPVAAG
mmetsp:Transcript_144274/g.204031  ORF Transcript_144274/g.204031 Transcript_144274/m.204031 type:complete len:195 (+) Transcript_144274:55-639(+)